MIQLYSFATPNGQKIHIALEELELPYTAHCVDITRGEQFDPEFLAVSPNNKIPAILDEDGPDGAPIAVFESGAILIYLADKTGRLMPSDPRGRSQVLQWLMFQMASVGPMLGQAHHFRQYAPLHIDYAVDRYTKEARRIYRVLDRQLEGREWVSGDYSIADIAIFPWILPETQGQHIEDFPHLAAWLERMRERPSVQRGFDVLKDKSVTVMDDEARDNLFGDAQYRDR